MCKSKLKPVAITVSSYYLDKQLYSVKIMAIIINKLEAPVWHTVKILCTGRKCSKLLPMAVEYSLDNNIPFISNLIQGSIVLATDRRNLAKHYGVSLSEIIS